MLIIALLLFGFLGMSQPSEKVLFDKINKANEEVNSNPTLAGELIQKALEESIATENKRATAYCYNTLGAINYKLNSYGLSIDYYLKSIKLFEEENEPSGRYNSLKYIGTTYEANGDLVSAKKYYLIFLNLALNSSIEEDVLAMYSNIGRVSYNSGDQKDAEVYFNKALKIEESRQNEKGIAQIKLWLGMINEKLGNDEQAIQNYNESQQISQSNNDVLNYNSSSNTLGDYYSRSQRNGEAIEVQQQAYKFNKKQKNRKGELDNAQNIAKYQLSDNNPSDAIPYIKESIDISKELGDIEALTDANLLLSQAYEQQGEYDSALIEYKKYLNLMDSVQNVRAKDELLALKMSKDLNEKVQELENLKKELDVTTETFSTKIDNLEKKRAEEIQREELKAQRTQIIMWSLLGLLIVVAIATVLISKSAAQKRKANQLLALKSLRSQMNPHFIFNSLNSVNSFIAMNDERSANKYLSEFSRLMRGVMENSKHDFVPLTSEMDILKMYLNLEHLRFQDKFDFKFKVDPSLDADGVEIPPMLIQPYIENAIWHGLRYKDVKGNLSVEFIKRNNSILAIIEDDGIGRDKSMALKTKNQKQTISTAMKNIEGRLTILNQLHKTNLDVSVIDLMKDGEPCGTRVEIKIPYNMNKEAA